ncbi:cation diffusion facilitator family transporter [Cetobacterium sp.]|uniref:cation diffusion facilitator family transporter n=1 Tax=Cetobacterium sp. TaxID=2071632 RepID=UPI003F3614B4
MYKTYSKKEILENVEEFRKIDTDFILNEEGVYISLEVKKEIIAYAFLEKRVNDCYLRRIFVKKDERFKSYGRKLISFIQNTKFRKSNIIVEPASQICDFLTKVGFRKEKDGSFIIKNIEEKATRKKEGQKAAIFSIFWNIILATTKIGFGIFSNSRALLADGFNSLSDTVTSSGILLGIHFSNMPEDEAHPFGHEKIESIIGVIMGIFMIVTAFELGRGGIGLLLSQEKREVPGFIAIYFALFSSIVKYFMYKQKMRIGIETENRALIADAKDSRNDIFSSLGVVLGILFSIFINPIFDVIISILVSILIFKEGVSVILDITDTILDKQDSEFLEKIEYYIYSNTNIKNVHDLTMRKSGDKIFLELHIRLPKDMSVYEAHKISEDLESSIKQDFKSVKNTIIHLECIID